MFAFCFSALLLLVAGSVDLLSVNSARTRIQDIADAAALAGANELSMAIDDQAAIARAQAFVDAHVSEWKHRPEIVRSVTVIEQAGQRIVQVNVDGNSPSFFGSMLPPGGWNYGVVSHAVSVGMTPLCVLVTGTTEAKVLNVKDAGSLQAPACMVHSNKDIVVEGGRILAAAVQAVTAAQGTISPAAGTGAARIADPFAAMTLDENQACTNSVKVDVKTGVIRLPPGVHCEDQILAGDSALILEPGEHWFLGSALVIKEDARLTGEDVVLFFDKDAKFEFKDHAMVNLDGRKSGAYAGMVMVATRGNTQDFLITSDHVDRLLGVIYVPSAQLIVEGKSEVARDSAWTVIVARMLQLKGSPSLIINADYASSDVPVPDGVGPRSSGAQLVQ